jgi:hypothetical protein
MKCSFCEGALVCQACQHAFQPADEATYAAAFQPDTEVLCPRCHQKLVCRACGFVYGEPSGDDDEHDGGAG